LSVVGSSETVSLINGDRRETQSIGKQE